MLRFAFAASTGNVDSEFLRYRGEALNSIRRRMSSLDKAITESTLGAILLLAGIEVRIAFFSISTDLTGLHP